MADAPEIPGASDPFEKRVAISIAGFAVVLSVVGNKGDNAKTDAIIQTNEASNRWSHYQSKSLKEGLARVERSILELVQTSAPPADIAKHREWLGSEMARYKADQEGISVEAKKSQEEAERCSRINDRCDQSALLLQIGIVVASVAILSKWRLFWFISLLLGVVGTVIGVTAFTM